MPEQDTLDRIASTAATEIRDSTYLAQQRATEINDQIARNTTAEGGQDFDSHDRTA
jgi:hypothetical protein